LTTKAEENLSDFVFESVLFQSDRLFESLELRQSVTDLDIYEHLNKPYLTGTISFTDARDFVSGVDILGAERITIKLRSLRKETETITKVFYIDSIKVNHKTNDNVQFVVLHLIEDIGYIANLQNISRAYSGKCSDIIQKISHGYLNKEVYSSQNDKQSIKVIVPNLNPLEAMMWLSSRATTVNGYPFYLYSTLVGDKLKLVDLGTLFTQNPINMDIPYRYYQGASNSNNYDVQRRTILEYDQKDTEDLFGLIKKGLIGSEYRYVDTVDNTQNTFHFDVTKDLLQPIIKKGVVPQNSNNVMYSPDYVYKEKSYNLLDSRVITQIGGSSAFDDLPSYSESTTIADYKLNIISRAMHEFLKKTPMQIAVNGIDFIDGDVNTATGNMIRLEFLKSLPESKDGDFLDKKKSGDYLIFATQYMFKKEKCDVRLSCVKLGNLRK